jgi:hypothetical protein
MPLTCVSGTMVLMLFQGTEVFFQEGSIRSAKFSKKVTLIRRSRFITSEFISLLLGKGFVSYYFDSCALCDLKSLFVEAASSRHRLF